MRKMNSFFQLLPIWRLRVSFGETNQQLPWSYQSGMNIISVTSDRPSAIDSESIKPLSVLHSGLKREWW